VAGGHQLGVGVEGQLGLARGRGGAARQVDAGLGRQHQQRTLGRVAQHRPAGAFVLGRQQLRVVAQRAACSRACSAGRRRGSAWPAFGEAALRRVADAATVIVRGARPPGSHSATAVISLRVSVPVLSLQMTVVEPSVSTADSRRMIAPRAAMRCMPTASAIVIATGSPRAPSTPSG
jgi:hypothetical protein